MNKKYKYIIGLVGILIIILISLFVYNKIINKGEEVDDIDVSINYNSDDEEMSDVSNQENINLDEYDGNLSITSGGVYTLSGSLEGYIYVDTDEEVKLVLNGVTITNDDGPCIYIKNAKNAYIELVGDNKLSDGESYSNFDEEVNGCIFSKDDLIISGDGNLEVDANYQDGIVSKDDLKILSGNITIDAEDDGLRGTDSVVIKGGTLNITSGGDAIKSTLENDSEKGYILIEDGDITIEAETDGLSSSNKIVINGGTLNITTGGSSSNASTQSSWGAWGNNSSSTDTASAKGIKATSNILITGGTFTLDTSDDAIHSNGSIIISGGTFSISSGDDGIHADEVINIENTTIDITKSYEGIEAGTITVNNGTISIVSSDDGFNAASGDGSNMNRPGYTQTTSSSDNVLTINGGEIYVNSTGDGLDANGKIVINGGTVFVDGPTDNSNTAIDFDSECLINGGTVVAVGSNGMLEIPSSDSDQNVVVVSLTSSQTGTITIGDITYTPSKSYSAIIVSSSSLKTNKEYDLDIDDVTYDTIKISSVVTQVGSTNQMGGGNPQQQGGGRR